MIGPKQIWRREPVGNDEWDEIRILGTFEEELTVTSNVGSTEVVSAIAAEPDPERATWRTKVALSRSLGIPTKALFPDHAAP